MITIKAEQEHYCLLTDGANWAVAERRAGRYHPLGNCSRRGVTLDDPGAASLLLDGHHYPEPTARDILTEVATEWRDLCEHIR